MIITNDKDEKILVFGIPGWLLFIPALIVISAVKLFAWIRILFTMMIMKLLRIPLPTKADMRIERRRVYRQLIKKHGSPKSPQSLSLKK